MAEPHDRLNVLQRNHSYVAAYLKMNRESTKIKMKLCIECSKEANYKCPKCREPYCSSICCNAHKLKCSEGGEIARPKTEPILSSATPAEGSSSSTVSLVHQMLLPKQLDALRDSVWIRDALKSQRLCSQIKAIDESTPEQRQQALKIIRASNPEFDSFVTKLCESVEINSVVARVGVKRKAELELQLLPVIDESEEDEEGQIDEEDETADEFTLLHENISEYSLSMPLTMPRRESHVCPGQNNAVSAIHWDPPAANKQSAPLVLLHGTAMNAHTFDTVLLALSSDSSCRACFAVDLPGHGHSSHYSDGDYSLPRMAKDIKESVSAWCKSAGTDRGVVLVGMSLGGLVALQMAGDFPELVLAVVLVDITPSLDEQKTKEIRSFIAGPPTWDFNETLARAASLSSRRSESSLRRGLIHNSRQNADGSWSWRYDQRIANSGATSDSAEIDRLWSSVMAPPVLHLVWGIDSRVVTEDDVRALLERRPDCAVHRIAECGHSVQGDQPLELARLLAAIEA